MTLKRFSNNLFHVCPLLSHWGDDHEQTFQSFLAYKTRVPVCGAIMLNETWDKVHTQLVCIDRVLTPLVVSACSSRVGSLRQLGVFQREKSTSRSHDLNVLRGKYVKNVVGVTFVLMCSQVLEETGYDLDGQINPTDVVEITIRDQSLSLYIVPDVPEDYAFETRTRKEISVRVRLRMI